MKSTSVELLESRIAPASASVAYIDVDGDLVKIIASKPGTAPPLDLADLTLTDGDPGGQLAVLTINDPGFDDGKIIFKVVKKAGGDGLAHVGYIDATGVDLDRVIVKGDLREIDAGDDVTVNDPGLNLLQVRTMGKFGYFTSGGAGDLESFITGALGTLKVAGDIVDVTVITTAPRADDCGIGSVFIGGDIIHGKISCFGPMGDVRIAGDVVGAIFSNGTMGDVRIGGDLSGEAFSLYRPHGVIHSNGTMGNVFIGGSIIGGAGAESGRVSSLGKIGNVRIVGDIIGGAGASSGQINSSVEVGNIRIEGNVLGGAGVDSALIFSNGSLGNVRIDGDLTGMGAKSGAIVSVAAMGDLRIRGNITGDWEL